MTIYSREVIDDTPTGCKYCGTHNMREWKLAGSGQRLYDGEGNVYQTGNTILKFRYCPICGRKL